VILVRTIAKNQTSPGLDLTIESKFEVVSNMMVITTQDQIVKPLVFMGGQEHQLICIYLADIMDKLL
jgi:hypothetical protein